MVPDVAAVSAILEGCRHTFSNILEANCGNWGVSRISLRIKNEASATAAFTSIGNGICVPGMATVVADMTF